MPDVAKLKKKAAEFELKKQFDKALVVYVEILDGIDQSDDDEVDVALFNRVGDLYLKQGNVADAVDYYEQAVDRYAEGGFFNNAIALCNKILRNSPGRASVYYKLGKISAHKGFKADAKASFLEYADRMQQAGKIDEAFRALKEFADLCPDQDDIRLMLADQLSKKDRGAEAVEQLQLLHERYTLEGRHQEASATVDRMKAIDPDAEPRSPGSSARQAVGDLVFLDLNDSAPAKRRSSVMAKRATSGLEILHTGDQAEVVRAADAAKATAPAAPIAPPRPSAPVAAQPAPTPELLETPSLEPAVLDGVTRAAEFELGAGMIDLEPPVSGGGSLLEGLEATNLGGPATSSDNGSLLDFEPTSFGGATVEPPAAAPPRAPRKTTPPAAESLGDDLLDFELPASTPSPAPRQSRPSLHDLPMLVDDEGAEDTTADDSPSTDFELPMLVDAHGDEPAADDGGAIGGDLMLIMPDDAVATPPAPRASRPVEAQDVPLMDLELPAPDAGREPPKSLRESGALEMVELDDEDVATPPVRRSSTGMEIPDVDSALSRETDPSLVSIPTPPMARRPSTMMAAQSVEMLQVLVEDDPEDHALRRRLGEAMLESGDREGGLRELETAMVGYERAEDLAHASAIADEVVRLNPSSVKHHQKRVEYAFRTNERGRLIEAYLELADALFRAGQMEKSRAIYQRVIDLAPDDERARAALDSIPEPEPEPAPPPPPARGRSTSSVSRTSTSSAPVPSAPAATRDDEFVNLGDWLRDDEGPKDTRMVVAEEEPTGDEAADFADMLKKFKQGIAENVEDEDHQSHYDLGVAYKEMGLMDEAIGEFQKALRAPSNRGPTYEALGQCFIEKGQHGMASTILGRALHEKGMSDDQLVGVLYLLGLCAEEQGKRDLALEYYQRVFVIDIQFRDVGERLAALEGASS